MVPTPTRRPQATTLNIQTPIRFGSIQQATLDPGGIHVKVWPEAKDVIITSYDVSEAEYDEVREG